MANFEAVIYGILHRTKTQKLGCSTYVSGYDIYISMTY